MAKRSVRKSNTRIRVRWDSFEPDVVTYKPARPLFKPEDVYVTIDLKDVEGNFSQEIWPDGDLTPYGAARVTKLFKEAMARVEDS